MTDKMSLEKTHHSSLWSESSAILEVLGSLDFKWDRQVVRK